MRKGVASGAQGVVQLEEEEEAMEVMEGIQGQEYLEV
jgi:hypothetical protein